MNEIPYWDTKPHALPNRDPARHLFVGHPRIKSEPILVGRIAWTVCWELRQTALPTFTQPKLLCPCSDD